jgi:hypothetical protein
MSFPKSWWPGVSSRSKASPSFSKLITAEETEMPAAISRSRWLAGIRVRSDREKLGGRKISSVMCSSMGLSCYQGIGRALPTPGCRRPKAISRPKNERLDDTLCDQKIAACVNYFTLVGLQRVRTFQQLVRKMRQKAKHMTTLARAIDQGPLTPNLLTAAADYIQPMDCDTDLREG